MLPLSVVLIQLYVELVASENVVITVQGRVQGVSHDGYTSYTGIPYAQINGDDGRFKQAGLAPSWSGIREASTPNCYPTSEVAECLRLDVHVPKSGSEPWPVFVWVRSSTGIYHPKKLVQQGVIVVIVYHRLGPVGFMCLKEEQIPGNAAAKDVILALRWVRDNIVAFRGNPAKVIVAGQGFGAAIVEATTLSPMAQGLYHGVILQSGSILSPLTFNFDAIERADALAVTVSDGEDIASSLLNSDIADLVTQAAKLNKPYFPFGLCIEKGFKKEERFLHDSPLDLLKSNNVHPVPIIIGYNSDEAQIFASNLKGARVLRRVSGNTKSLLPQDLKLSHERDVEHVERQIKNMYFKNNKTMAAVLAYYRDAYFLNHIYRSVRLHASASHMPVYFYRFSHSGSVGVYPEPGVKKSGAAHSDELAYLFSETNFDDEDGSVQQKLVKLWTNFAKYLTPTPRVGDSSSWDPVDAHSPRVGDSSSWDPVDAHSPRLLDIGPELNMEQFPHAKAMQMWDNIYEKYYYSRYRNSQT